MSNGEVVRPDVFISGVMKGGTTILHDYICTHPDIEAGSKKEIHYFSLHYDKGSDWYEAHFADVTAGKRTIDASPTYFDAANTLQIPALIKAYTENPKVILITRDPIARAVSQFTHLKHSNKIEALQDVNIDDFFSMSLEDAYRQNEDIGFSFNQVLTFSMYYRKFINYQAILDSKNFLAIDNDALRNNPKTMMERIFEFLDVPYVDNKLFGVVKHSNGSSVSNISKTTFDRLADIFYPDYEKYCAQAGIPFVEISHSHEILRKTAT